MKATINYLTVTVTLELTQEQLNLIRSGIGKTSQDDRESIGMTKKESVVLSDLYWALDNAKNNLE